MGGQAFRMTPRAAVRARGLAPVLLLLVLTGCRGEAAQVGAPAPEAQPRDTAYELAIDDALQFEPTTLTVPAGTVVEVVNRATTAHSVTADVEAPVPFDTGLVAEGDTAQLRLDEPGRYPYHCSRHPELMNGLIVVEASS